MVVDDVRGITVAEDFIPIVVFVTGVANGVLIGVDLLVVGCQGAIVYFILLPIGVVVVVT